MDVDVLKIPETARWMIKNIQGLLCSALTVKKQLEERIKQAAIAYDETTIRLLVTIYGVSVLGASALLADAVS